MKKMNCWDFKGCGRQAGGEKVAELGQCEASVKAVADGMNGGQNGGRVCWAVSGTLCGGKVQGVFAAKVTSCIDCNFFKKVLEEEGANLLRLSTILKKLQEDHILRSEDELKEVE
jgi:hypothetical protein